ncbi:pyridoxal-phosphate dependent enzyme [Shewanella violacea]|uniref:1-aminocyclopropane-1-carboxylate deaminase n=1 Tax=Shewanella violacea (strain JCM 10179 / CIP 106290 / LMG 19151 / DSS12) TaxID=637905 RepID=D4ZLN1_SHEVD|nr:pyridoxal-phosphate dependent enzyme [Shewanella violacea]BAJ02580.1 conserved hypothetical protein [Shewanella violacea DSS12]
MKLSHTPVDTIVMFNRHIFVKRDDLLHPEFSGNKARKFAYFLEHEFPGVTKLIGYGSPQANSLYSMSALAKLKGWSLDFYVDHIASHIKLKPSGNYGAALANGANIISLDSLDDRGDRDTHTYIQEVVLPNETHAIFVPEGGRCEYAEFGVSKLAEEIAQWAKDSGLEHLVVFLPSGTGTTALYLNKYYVEQEINIQVLTCAAVGGSSYLIQQFTQLADNPLYHPEIVALPKKYHFGKLYPEFYEMWKTISLTGIAFELLYDPLGWMTLEHHLSLSQGDVPILYLHQGGLLGNETMLPRYIRKYGA